MLRGSVPGSGSKREHLSRNSRAGAARLLVFGIPVPALALKTPSAAAGSPAQISCQGHAWAGGWTREVRTCKPAKGVRLCAQATFSGCWLT